MRTDDLIAMLARGPVAVDPRTTERRLSAAMALGAVVAAVLLALSLGPRADLAEAVRLPAFWLKVAFPLAIAAAAHAAASRLARPAGTLGAAAPGLVAPFVAVWLFAAVELAQSAPGQRAGLLLGHTAASCIVSIALLAVPVFVAACLALRTLAPTRLRAAGAAAGLLAGAVSTLVYAFHCPEMEAPFIAVWYVLGMLLPCAVGASAGPRLLRWT